jgi:hypothetical protein
LIQVQCNGCGTQAFTDNHADPDAALQCREGAECCGEDHHHGGHANRTGEPCRPVTITLMPESIKMTMAGG